MKQNKINWNLDDNATIELNGDLISLNGVY